MLRHRAFQNGLFALILTVLLGQIIVLANDVISRLNALSIARSDNLMWNLSQAEVELLRYRTALSDPTAHTDDGLSEIRKRFDIFYSRVSTLKESTLYEPLRTQDVFYSRLQKIHISLDECIPVIDGSNVEMTQGLPKLKDAAKSMTHDVRAIAVQGLTLVSANTELHRKNISRILMQLAALIAALVGMLLVLLIALQRIHRMTKMVSEENLAARARLEATIKASLDAILVIEPGGIITEYNGAAQQIFGYSRDEVLGNTPDKLFIVPEHRAAYRKGMLHYRETGQSLVIDAGKLHVRAMRKNGDSFPIELSISRVTNPKATVFVAFVRDMSEQVSAEKELRKARDDAEAGERTKSSLLTLMSHEIRTPLNGILGTIELLKDSDLIKSQTDLIKAMQTSGDLLMKHVNDVLEMSKTDAGEARPTVDTFDLNNMLRDLVNSQQAATPLVGNTLKLGSLPEDGQWVHGDKTLLQRTLLNLIGNAIKFTLNGEITVEAERLTTQNSVEFRVTDTGQGISEDDLERVFDDFVTIDNTYRRRSGGTGLGLGIARRMVKTMGGEIGAESIPDEGSLFWFRIPLAVACPDQPPTLGEIEPGQQTTPSLSILIVEDNKINRLVAREMLVREGHRVTEAASGEEGVQTANTTKFDLILMDISMPDIDGLLATRMIRTGHGASARTPVVALTAHALPEDQKRIKQEGIADILIKPMTYAQIRIMIGRHNRRAKTGSQHDSESKAPAENPTVADHLGPEKANLHLTEMLFGIETLLSCLEGGNPWTEAQRETAHKLAGSAAIFTMTDLFHALVKASNLTDSTTPLTEHGAALTSIRRHLNKARQAHPEAAHQTNDTS